MIARVRPLGALLLAVGLAATWATTPAQAAESKSVQVVGQNDRSIDFLVYLDPSVTAAPDADVSSTVVISGTTVPSEATLITEKSTPKEAILVLDDSGSMRGPRLASAKEAAINYVNGLPKDVEIGLVSFNDDVTLEVRPTTDKQAVIQAISSLKAGQKTALYDGIIAGLDVADAGKGARLLVLSDGGDTVSAATIDDVKSRAATENVPIDIVALSPSTVHADALRSISTPTAGQFLLATDVTGLNEAFQEATGSFGGKVAVTADIPDNVDASGKFAIVTVGLDDTDYTGTTQLPNDPALGAVGGAVTPTVPTDGATTPGQAVTPVQAGNTSFTWLYAILVALIVIVAALAIASYRQAQRSRLRTEQVLWYSSAMRTGQPQGRRPELQQGGMLESLDEWMSTKSWYPKIDNKLDNGSVRVNVATWLMIRMGAALVGALLIGLLIGFPLVGAVIGGLLGWMFAGMWLNRREAKARKAFDEELPDFLLLIASSMRAGLSFQQALDSSAEEGQGELSRQMRRALSEVQLGSPIEQALTRVADRMQSEDLRWTVTALGIQREVGGNLSNILETAAMTVKGREELRREVRALSADGRLSGWVLGAMPIGLFLFLLLTNRSYISFFWTSIIGFISLIVLLVMYVLGAFWIRRIIRIEV